MVSSPNGPDLLILTMYRVQSGATPITPISLSLAETMPEQWVPWPLLSSVWTGPRRSAIGGDRGGHSGSRPAILQWAASLEIPYTARSESGGICRKGTRLPDKPQQTGARPGIHDRCRDTWTVRDPETHARSVRAMFARIAGAYDFMNHLLSLNLDRRWRRRLVARIDADAWEVLDLCAGTGDLAVECLRTGRGRLLLVSDFCPEMLGRGWGKGLGSPRRGADGIDRSSLLLTADAQVLPLRDASCDAVMIAFGARNLADVRAGLREMTRVLRPGGQLLVLEFFRADPAATGPLRGPSSLLRWWLAAVLPLLGRLFAHDGSAYGYLPASMGRFLSVSEFTALLTECGLGDIDVERQSLGVAHLVAARATERAGAGAGVRSRPSEQPLLQ